MCSAIQILKSQLHSHFIQWIEQQTDFWEICTWLHRHSVRPHHLQQSSHWQDFSKVRSLLHWLDTMTIKLPFEKLCQCLSSSSWVVEPLARFLKSQIVATLTRHNDDRAAFWETLPVSFLNFLSSWGNGKNSEKSARESFCLVNVVASWLLRIRTATRWNTLQYTAIHCNTLQDAATHCNTCSRGLTSENTHCNTLKQTATHCNTLQHTVKHCNTCSRELIFENTHCNTLQQTAIHCNALLHTAKHCNTCSRELTFENTHCNTLQQAAIHCYTLQHTATHCNTCSRGLTSENGSTPCTTLQQPIFSSRELTFENTHYNTLQQTAIHCNTLQHAATHVVANWVLKIFDAIGVWDEYTCKRT